MNLFGDPVAATTLIEQKFKVNWSYSKMQLFWDCPRKFYYKYYGSKKRAAKQEPLKNRLIELAKLSNKYMAQGDVIHQLVRLYFKKEKGGDPWDQIRIVNFSTKIIDDIISYNQRVRTGTTPGKEVYPQPVLKELYYQTISDADLKKELTQAVTTCLTNFFEIEAFYHLREGAIKLPSKIESDASFSINDWIDVDGKMDLAFVKSGTLLISDWKTGKKEIQDTSLQLLVYALWASEFKDWQFTNVEIQKAYLHEGVVEKLEYSGRHVNRARARIMQDAEMLKEMDGYGKDAVADAFAQHIGKNCLHCPFEEICHGKILNDGN